MLDEIKALGIEALLVAVIGGIAAYLLGMFIGPVQGMQFGGIIAAVIALLLLLYLKTATDVEMFDIWSLVILLLMVSIVGGFVVGVFPAATPFIFTFNQAFTVQGLAWAFVYIGIAKLVSKSLI